MLLRLWRKNSKPLNETEIKILLEHDYRYKYFLKRWPKLLPFYCGAPNCKSIIWHKGICAKCGGGGDLFGLAGNYFRIRINDKYYPLHRIIAEPQEWQEVHHIDHNPMNNIPTNLECLLYLEHKLQHALDQIKYTIARVNPTNANLPLYSYSTQENPST